VNRTFFNVLLMTLSRVIYGYMPNNKVYGIYMYIYICNVISYIIIT
jgi:hypothetical protein